VDLEATVRRLELIEASRTVQARYAETIDAQAYDRLSDVFAPHAVVAAPGRRYEGIDAIVEFYRAVAVADPAGRRHFITNTQVMAADTQTVSLTATFLYVAGTGGDSVLGWGRYTDDFALVDGNLRCVAKDIQVEYRGPVTAGWGAALQP